MNPMIEMKMVNITFTCFKKADQEIYNPILRMIICKNEAYRLPQTDQQIRVLSGMVWATSGRDDIILNRGEGKKFASSEDVVISSADNQPLVVEIRRESKVESWTDKIFGSVFRKSAKNWTLERILGR